MKTTTKLAHELRAALRTEPDVEFALLFGSMARGDDGPESDIDILVALRERVPGRLVELEVDLGEISDREVHLTDFEATSRNELLLATAVEDGRILVDRENRWPSLRSELDSLRERADRALEDGRRQALSAVDAFLAKSSADPQL
jgi:uncharacterized protein